MKTTRLYTLLLALLLLPSVIMAKKQSPYLVATDYVKADGKKDCSAALQKLIDDNPHRTIYFPDGVYLLSQPLRTPANPEHAVHLNLANFATLKAMDTWQADGGALVELGASEPFNSITLNGSNYGIEGGIFDGSGVADGICIASGRETRINHVSIKHTRIGLYIKKGANNGSSDSDIMDVNIVGNDAANSIGVLVEGFDNTFTNMRIAHVAIGMHIKTGGNSMKNIHPLYIYSKDKVYEKSIGFLVEGSNNWLDYCYSDQFATGFRLGKGVVCNLTDCFAYWYSGKGAFQTTVSCDGPLESFVTGLHSCWHGECKTVNLLVGEKGGHGCLQNVYAHERQFTEADVSDAYMTQDRK